MEPTRVGSDCIQLVHMRFVSASVIETQPKFMVDTGAAVSLLSSKIWSALGGGKQIVGVVGSPLMVHA